MAGTQVSLLGAGGYPRPPYGAFSAKFAPIALPNPIGFNLAQLDRGLQFHTVPTYRGPSLGWVQTTIKPQRLVVASVDVFVQPGDGIILVNVAATLNVFLPSIAAWVNEPVYRPYESFDRGIWIKDIGGNAGSFPITIRSQPGELIDHQPTASILSNFGIAEIYPLTDLTGWFISG